MAFQDALDEAVDDGADTDESAPSARAGGRSADPFSMTWDTSHYDVDDQQIDRALGVLVAVTNLL